MFRFLSNPLKVELNAGQTALDVNYQPTTKALFDICDSDGRILKSGRFEPGSTRVIVEDLLNAVYVFLILDGERIRSRRFEISR